MSPLEHRLDDKIGDFAVTILVTYWVVDERNVMDGRAGRRT